MTSIKKLNAIAGTSYTRWKQVAKALTPKEDPVKEMDIQDQLEAESVYVRPEFPPRITNERVIQQMRGAGYQFEDGYPVRCPKGAKDFQAGDATWKFDYNGDLFAAWEPTRWTAQREVQYEALVDQPLVRAGDGTPADSMFTGHRQWAKQWNKQDAIRDWAHRDNRVAWFEAGVVVYQTTFGALLDQSIGAG